MQRKLPNCGFISLNDMQQRFTFSH